MIEVRNRLVNFLFASVVYTVLAVVVILASQAVFHFVTWTPYKEFPFFLLRAGIGIGILVGMAFACTDDAATV